MPKEYYKFATFHLPLFLFSLHSFLPNFSLPLPLLLFLPFLYKSNCVESHKLIFGFVAGDFIGF